MPRASGWRWFSAWAIVGGLLFFSYLTGLSIGIFVLPFALLGLWLVTQVSRAWPELLGAASGAGLLCLGVAVANRDYEPCPDGPVMLLGESSFTCGGSEPLPWLLAGIVLAFTAPLAYSIARQALRSS